jgi:hypothetical protein
MASLTLAQSALLAENDLVAGVIETIVTVNKMFALLPFDGIEGNAIAFDRELVLGDTELLAVGGTVAAKASTTVTQATGTLTTIVGDAEVNGLIQSTRSATNDQTATQVAGKAKSAGRKYQDQMINGSGSGANIQGLLSLVAAGQTIDAGTNGADLTFELLDALLSKVIDKDGVVDFISLNDRTLRKYFSLLRGLGGASMDDTFTLPSGEEIPAYRGTPLLRNDFIPIDQTQGTATTATSMFAGNFDDGSRTIGIAGLTSSNDAGIQIRDVGWAEAKDEFITRVVWYCGLANFSQLGLAMVKGLLT